MIRIGAAKISVNVNDSQWRPVLSLRDAKPDDAVFVLDPQSGSIRFGNGVHGAKPSVGSTITVSYRNGAGSSGNLSRKIYNTTDVMKFWVVVGDRAQILGWGRRPSNPRVGRKR
jgi:hypothetical protein